MTDFKQIIQPANVAEPSDVAPVFPSFTDFHAECNRRILEALALTLRDEELARDAAAEGMTRAFQKWSEVGAYSNPAGWVCRVGLNWARSWRRKFRREVPHSELLDDAATPSDFYPELDAAIARLPIDQRAVVVLRYHLDWSEAATAEALGIAPGTVKSRLSRAIEGLRPSVR